MFLTDEDIRHGSLRGNFLESRLDLATVVLTYIVRPAIQPQPVPIPHSNSNITKQKRVERTKLIQLNSLESSAELG